MIKKEHETNRRLKTETYHTELAIIGGGLSGVCTAITAARKGVKVVLVQDRPVLGGNSSSEIHLWMAPINTDLPIGTHTIEVRATDMFGRTFKQTKDYRIEQLKSIELPQEYQLKD